MNQNKLGFEPSEFRCWIGKVCAFLKLKQLVYLNTCLALFQKPIIYTLLTCRKILQHFTVELMFSSIPFFPSILLKWKKDDRKIQQSKTILSFRNFLLKIGPRSPKPADKKIWPNWFKAIDYIGLRWAI